MNYERYEDCFCSGVIGCVLGKRPVPPNGLTINECIAWGDGFQHAINMGLTNKRVVEEFWEKSGLSGTRTKKTSLSSS